ncbi:hypothetical protein AUG19_01845 [archaeon 13_1_20CM_2_54_9]|nr:MAG: hypothetical protein AUJ07_07130 [Crenarchaeota archaeon 13_1_40CM_3_53_5]OLE76937.1 MAG: hypothetical protein AUG19_01845 [archaeon 13_1_20CM_2_54_9]
MAAISAALALLTVISLGYSNEIFQEGAPSLQATSGSVTLEISRDAAYYLEAIPAPRSQTELWFDWTVTAPNASNGTGMIEFSRDNVNWSNLVSFPFVSGQATGRQFIDSSWARPGQNYLRASDNKAYSTGLTIVVYVNYYEALLLILSPFLAAAIVATVTAYLRRRKRRQVAPTE